MDGRTERYKQTNDTTEEERAARVGAPRTILKGRASGDKGVYTGVARLLMQGINRSQETARFSEFCKATTGIQGDSPDQCPNAMHYSAGTLNCSDPRRSRHAYRLVVFRRSVIGMRGKGRLRGVGGSTES
jgi:hypothetical protein